MTKKQYDKFIKDLEKRGYKFKGKKIYSLMPHTITA